MVICIFLWNKKIFCQKNYPAVFVNPRLSLIRIWTKSNFRPLPRYFSYLWTGTLKAFQYKVLNSILYTNAKLFKIGYTAEEKCTFSKSESETLIHLFFNCVYSKVFWKDFEFYYYSVWNKLFHLSLQDVFNRHYCWTMSLTKLFSVNSQTSLVGLQKITTTSNYCWF